MAVNYAQLTQAVVEVAKNLKYPSAELTQAVIEYGMKVPNGQPYAQMTQGVIEVCLGRRSGWVVYEA